jgi:DNA-binding NtrC family response regulator
MKILVVQENQAEADWIANLLNRNPSYRALSLHNRTEALRHATLLIFDLVLIGRLPEDSLGLGLGERLRKLMPSCKVVLMVRPWVIEYLKPHRREFEYLVAPVEPEGLLKKVEYIRNECSLEELAENLRQIYKRSEEQERIRRRERALKQRSLSP